MRLRQLKAATFTFALLTMGGCLAAAGAGVGAGIYLSDRGAESLVDSPIDRTFAATQQVFREMGIAEEKSASEQSGSAQERQLDGKRDDKNIKVTLKTEGGATRVEVMASEDMIVWDKKLASDILEKIVKMSSRTPTPQSLQQ
jgi:hypothetical protein